MKPRTRTSLLVALATAFLLSACGGDDGLEAASEELSEIQEEVAEARAAVEERKAKADEAEEALEAARETLARAEAKLAEARADVAKAANDAVLFRTVQQRLLDDSRLEGVAISARVQKRVVTLEGSVPSEELKRRAEKVAADTTGVATVVNQITVQVAAKD